MVVVVKCGGGGEGGGESDGDSDSDRISRPPAARLRDRAGVEDHEQIIIVGKNQGEGSVLQILR